MPAAAVRRTTKADLSRQVERLEATCARLAERLRSTTILLERAEQDRDDAFRRLTICAEENAVRRQLLTEARATIASLEAATP